MLLMKAAESAAIADGVAVPSSTTALHDTVKSEDASTTSADPSTTTAAPAASAIPTNGDKVAAALAMVAAVNGTNTSTNAPVPGQAPVASINNNLLTPQPAVGTETGNAVNGSNNPVVGNPVLGASASIKPAPSNYSSLGTTSAGTAAHMLATNQPTSTVTSQPSPSPVPKPPARPHSSSGRSTSSVTSGASSKKKGPSLRRGKWTAEEEAYANRLIQEFKAGLLPLTDGTTLRTFLSKLLNCDPMRISKKFVGNNCIGKQVFRRRTNDIKLLTPEQIQQSRAELSELERRFLERVAQTNRVKSTNVSQNSSGTSNNPSLNKKLDDATAAPPTPPWLRPPNGFQHGTGATTAAAALSSGTANRAAALVGRSLLQGNSNSAAKKARGMTSSGSAGLLALMEMELQRRQSKQNLNQSMGNVSSANNLLAAAAAAMDKGNSSGNLSGTAMAQIVRNASAARMSGLAGSNRDSISNLLKSSGLSHSQLSQLAREQARQSSTNSLSQMIERQSSLDALMSLDLQSLQSIDNLANLIHNKSGANAISKGGMKNSQWNSNGGANVSNSNLATLAALQSSGNLSSRNLVNDGRMESLMRTLSNGNVRNSLNNGGGSNATFNNLLQSMQNNLNGDGNTKNNLSNSSNTNIFGSAASALNLANMLRVDSSTGLTALRMQDGLTQRNSSVDDFLSLVASGDIPHQDPRMLNVPLQSVLSQQQQKNASNGSQSAASVATYLAQQQLLAQAAANSGGNGSSTININSLSAGLNANGNNSAASLLGQYTQQQRDTAAAMAQQQARQLNINASMIAAAQAQQEQQNNSINLSRKRNLSNDDGSDERPLKR